MYLYDHNPFNDVQYWLNRSVLGSFLPRCLRTWGKTQDDSIRDSMYCWAGKDKYGPIALYNASFTPPEIVFAPDTHAEAARQNLEIHVIPYVAAHPETQFDFFFPPYSAAEWSSMQAKGTLESMLTLRGVCFDVLSQYENVTIHDYSANADWVLNLDNYKDTLHYGQWINDEMTQCFATGDGIAANRDQLDAATRQLRTWAHALMDAGEWIYN